MAYIPQLTPTSPTNVYTDNVYHSWNPLEALGYGLPNCTAYAYGRFWSMANPTSATDNRPTLSLYDAKTWYGYTQDGYERGQTPKLGAIICWDDPDPNGGGHVAIVEEILPDGRLRTSNSAYTRDPDLMPTYYFFTELVSNTYQRPGGYPYIFQGFIYNPFVDESSKTSNILFFSKIMNRRKSNYGRKFMAPNGLPSRK